MKWQGRSGSGNILDRRGSGRRMAAGGGIGAIVIALIIYLLGGDPSQLLNTSPDQGAATEQIATSPEEDEMALFVSVVLKDTETVWGKIFEQSGSTYEQPHLVLFRDQVQSACGLASAASGPFYCPEDRMIYIDLAFCDQLRYQFGGAG
jgi:predicted metalloprotease